MIGWTLALTLLASPRANTQEAKTCLSNLVSDGYSDGWRVRTKDAFEVEQDDTQYLLVTMASSVNYRLTACGDARAEAIRIVVYDDMGRLVATSEVEGEPEGRSADLEFSPLRTSSYFVGVRLLTVDETAPQDNTRRRRRRKKKDEDTIVLPEAGVGLGILYR